MARFLRGSLVLLLLFELPPLVHSEEPIPVSACQLRSDPASFNHALGFWLRLTKSAVSECGQARFKLRGVPDSPQDRLIRDRNICSGEPVFKGTRVTLRTLLASLAAGDDAGKMLADFPSLKAEDIQAAIVFPPSPAP